MREAREPVVMVVDDQPANVRLLERMFKEAGFDRVVSTTESGKAAALYREHAPDLVLLDLLMPAPDGFAVLEDLKRIETDGFAPVLVMTGDTDRAVRVRALAAGARDFVTKPFDDAEVVARARNLVELRRLDRALRDQNALLERRVLDRTRELGEARLEVVRRLAAAAERRDTDTGAHIVRMSLACRRLAGELGLPADACEMILNASPLHDIGKIAIPDSVLLKPGPLTPEEWAIMKTHTTVGGEMLAGGTSPLLKAAHEIALTHHERWDGSGYPTGLAGEAIPLAGRICAVSDVFDALTSDRCYKTAWTVDQTAEEIRRGRGARFDPAVVDAFDRALPDLTDIRHGVAAVAP